MPYIYTGRSKASADYATASLWFTQAANYGLADSQYNLGILYKNGLGVEKNLTQAYKWFSLASNKGDKQATTQRDMLRSKMRTQDIFAAESLVSRWQPKKMNPVANLKKGKTLSKAVPKETLDANPLIIKAQILLHQLGFDAGPADGQVGPRTREAVKAFQKQIGISETGEITPELISHLSKMKS